MRRPPTTPPAADGAAAELPVAEAPSFGVHIGMAPFVDCDVAAVAWADGVAAAVADGGASEVDAVVAAVVAAEEAFPPSAPDVVGVAADVAAASEVAASGSRMPLYAASLPPPPPSGLQLELLRPPSSWPWPCHPFSALLSTSSSQTSP